MPTKVWVAGEEVLASDWNAYVQEQVVSTFPNAAARDAAILAPKTGQTCWIADAHQVQVYDAGVWRAVAGPTLYQLTGNAGTVGTSMTAVSNALMIPNLPYPWRATVLAGCLFTGVSPPNFIDFALYYDAAGAASPATFFKRGRASGGAQAAIQVAGFIEHLTAGPASFMNRGSVQAGTATVVADPNWSYIQALVSAL